MGTVAATKPDDQYADNVKALAKSWVERERALGLKGKKADDAAINFVVGAANAAEILGADKGTFVGIAWLVGVRGASQLREIAAGK